MKRGNPMQKLGIQDIKALATAGAKMGTATGKILEDGKVDWRDTMHVPSVLGALKDLSSVDFGQVLPQAKDLDDAECAELAAHFKATFDLPDDSVEVVVEQGLELVLMALQAILAFAKVGEKVRTVPAA